MRHQLGAFVLCALLALLGCDGSGTSASLTIFGSNGSDVLIGSSGDDHLRGFGGNDFLDGNSGDDLLDGGTGADDLDGSTGIDTATYTNSVFAVEVDLTRTFQRFGEAQGDSLDKIENVTGSSGGDVLRGDALPNRLIGGGGDDELTGRDGDDDLDGGPGNDFLSGGQGQDLCRGGSDNDNLSFGADDILLDGGSGDDTLLIQGDLDLGTAASIIRDMEVLNLQDSSANDLTLDPDDVEDVSDSRATVRVFGDAGTDGVGAASGAGTWTFTGTVSINGETYQEYTATATSGTTVTLQVLATLLDLGR